MSAAAMGKKDETFAWSVDASAKPKRSVWDRIIGKNDDDDDLPGPNAGATLWPTLPRKSAAAFG
jgi:hypothetical protein